jgi:glucose-6-phosphate isomerase
MAAFAARVRDGRWTGHDGRSIRTVVNIGIGGSDLGPVMAYEALRHYASESLEFRFVSNVDGTDFSEAVAGLDAAETLFIVSSKTFTTQETMTNARSSRDWLLAACRGDAAAVARHFVAVTGAGSRLDQEARDAGWLARFAMWDWVGGRTSQLSAVGLLPAALQGLDLDGLLAGAAAMDEVTRRPTTRANPAALLALAWHHATEGRGRKDMVVLPYKDRLLLFSRYLQQLVMESLGKERDLAGNVVHQGIAVYGNKGSTDQHAYVQQLREGVDNFFVTFIEVLRDRPGRAGLLLTW